MGERIHGPCSARLFCVGFRCRLVERRSIGDRLQLDIHVPAARIEFEQVQVDALALRRRYVDAGTQVALAFPRVQIIGIETRRRSAAAIRGQCCGEGNAANNSSGGKYICCTSCECRSAYQRSNNVVQCAAAFLSPGGFCAKAAISATSGPEADRSACFRNICSLASDAVSGTALGTCLEQRVGATRAIGRSSDRERNCAQQPQRRRCKQVPHRMAQERLAQCPPPPSIALSPAINLFAAS